jgi:hypothetical protein
MNDHDNDDFGEMNRIDDAPTNVVTVDVFSPETPVQSCQHNLHKQRLSLQILL